ncbi:transcriptional regulator [Salmonella enterica subsp. enterica serovar Telelkebir]|nr:transcriptional regulator [Salmonella enterica subsp. enterica serovar Telelkebir]ECB6713964.1 transcriptional regulator [Salmonella enterica subsp. enterica serovar Hvittingfoss]ELT8232566.1 transcriptional regulator [Salmonella enterica]
MQQMYLLLQAQVIEFCESGKVQGVVIERVSLKEWFPIYEVKDKELGTIFCSIRKNKEHEIRTWADLRLLTEFLKDKCHVDECLLRLKSMKN